MSERRERLLAHIAYWQPRLRMADWNIHLFNGEPNDANSADVHYKLGDMTVEIAIASAVTQEYEEAEVVHEMLELVLAPWNCLCDTLIELLPEERRGDFRDQRNIARHQVIHKLTSALLGPHYEPYNVVESH